MKLVQKAIISIHCLNVVFQLLLYVPQINIILILQDNACLFQQNAQMINIITRVLVDASQNQVYAPLNNIITIHCTSVDLLLSSVLIIKFIINKQQNVF